MTLQEKIKEFYFAKRIGGFIDRTQKQQKDHFKVVGQNSSQVVMKLSSEVTEPVSIFNIYFEPKKLVKISGEIADTIMKEFGKYFEVVAVAPIKDDEGVTGFFEVVWSPTSNTYVVKKKGTESVKFDTSKLGLLSEEEIEAERERLLLEKEAQKMAHIAKVNAKALELVKPKN